MKHSKPHDQKAVGLGFEPKFVFLQLRCLLNWKWEKRLVGGGGGEWDQVIGIFGKLIYGNF